MGWYRTHDHCRPYSTIPSFCDSIWSFSWKSTERTGKCWEILHWFVLRKVVCLKIRILYDTVIIITIYYLEYPLLSLQCSNSRYTIEGNVTRIPTCEQRRRVSNLLYSTIQAPSPPWTMTENEFRAQYQQRRGVSILDFDSDYIYITL